MSNEPTPPPAASARQVTLTGIAHDAKGGAILETDDGDVLYIRGLDGWPGHVLGQRVEVTATRGREKLFADPEVGEDGGISQGAFGDQSVLRDATWRLVE